VNVIKTAMAVRLLGTTYHRLFGSVRYGKIPAPSKDSSGDYLWRPRDLADAGVKLCMHQLRKGFGCRAAKILGKSGAAMLHELMRHSSMQVTMDFYANVDDALQDAIVRLT